MNTKKLKGLMAENNMTYSDGAKVIGICPVHFGRKMQGKYEFTISELKALADYFKVSVAIFFD